MISPVHTAMVLRTMKLISPFCEMIETYQKGFLLILRQEIDALPAAIQDAKVPIPVCPLNGVKIIAQENKCKQNLYYDYLK